MYYESDSQQEMGAYSMKNRAAIVIILFNSLILMAFFTLTFTRRILGTKKCKTE
jgi:hypothetical protein